LPILYWVGLRFEQMDINMQKTARIRAKQLVGLYQHLFVFILVNIIVYNVGYQANMSLTSPIGLHLAGVLASLLMDLV